MVILKNETNGRTFYDRHFVLEDAGQGKTRYTAIARQRIAVARQQHEEMGFYIGWGDCGRLTDGICQNA
jgi:hypothetical protein